MSDLIWSNTLILFKQPVKKSRAKHKAARSAPTPLYLGLWKMISAICNKNKTKKNHSTTTQAFSNRTFSTNSWRNSAESSSPCLGMVLYRGSGTLEQGCRTFLIGWGQSVSVHHLQQQTCSLFLWLFSCSLWRTIKLWSNNKVQTLGEDIQQQLET